MTPAAAGILAQVGAGLLIALTVEAKSWTRDAANDGDEVANGQRRKSDKSAVAYLVGICGVLISMTLTLTSVIYAKSLTGFAQHVASVGAATGFLPLLLGANNRLMPRITNQSTRVALWIIVSGIFIWLQFWIYTNAPGAFLG